MQRLETDHLVVGAGLSGLAFTDALVAAGDDDVVLVDRRDRVGGHWLDAYPFVRLHLPSAFYGVPSLPLGGLGRDDDGLAERATGAQVLAHLQSALDDVLLPTGRVRFLGLHEHRQRPDGTSVLVSTVTGEEVEVAVRRAVVDTTTLQGEVPATHRPGFTADADARCVPVGDLTRLGAAGERYTVMGAGKTGMDACTWLLAQGVPADRIRWVRPRDPYLLERAGLQPHDGVVSVMEGFSRDVEAVALASSTDELFARLEASGRLVRLDPAVAPTMYHCAIASGPELERLRSVEDVVRAGRVRHVGRDRLVLEEGEVAQGRGDVAVDCTASALVRRPLRPVFEPGRVTVQQVRPCSPSFNAALIGYVAATRDDPAEQNALCPPSAIPSVPADWIDLLRAGLASMDAWRAAPDVEAWRETCRLDVVHGLAERAAEPRAQEALLRFLEHVGPAVEKLAASAPPAQRSPHERAPLLS